MTPNLVQTTSEVQNTGRLPDESKFHLDSRRDLQASRRTHLKDSLAFRRWSVSLFRDLVLYCMCKCRAVTSHIAAWKRPSMLNVWRHDRFVIQFYNVMAAFSQNIPQRSFLAIDGTPRTTGPEPYCSAISFDTAFPWHLNNTNWLLLHKPSLFPLPIFECVYDYVRMVKLLPVQMRKYYVALFNDIFWITVMEPLYWPTIEFTH